MSATHQPAELQEERQQARGAVAGRPEGARRRPTAGAWIRFSLSVAFFVAFLGVVAGYRSPPGVGPVMAEAKVGAAPTTVSGPAADELRQTLTRKAEQALDEKVALLAGEERVEITRRKLGASLDPQGLEREVATLGRSGALLDKLLARGKARPVERDLPLPIKVDPAQATEVVGEIKARLDRAAKDAKLDLEHRKVLPDERGVLLNLIDSLVAIEDGVQRARQEIRLSLTYAEPRVTAKDLANIDVSHVIGAFETRYGNDPDRTFNLKVAAEKLNGRIIKPGEVFSFNGSVGERSEKEGFKTAPVIQAGELVDGVGGGTCQISSTLYAASFFAGLDSGKYTPHSRPSAYIAMGLDATVVWPRVDLELKNPHDFPVAIHAIVSQGRVRMELLGPKRPYTVAFEREVLEEKDYETIERMDDTLPVGTRLTDQPGVKGYRMKRHRYVYGERQKVLKHDVRVLYYPPTKEFIRVGTKPVNPDDPPAQLPEEKTKVAKVVPKHYRLVR